MDIMHTKVKATYEDIKYSIETQSGIQAIKDVLLILFIIFCAWNIIGTCLKLYNFGMSSAIKICFVGILIIGYIYYQDNKDDNDSNE